MKRVPFRQFVVNETPWCLWDPDIPARNLELIKKIDPDYFRYIADGNAEILEKSDDKATRQHASVSVRITYSHALETLFALLAATVQAPDCVVGWLLKYRPGDIPAIVAKINSGTPLLSNFDPVPRSWRDIADIVFSPVRNTDAQKCDYLIQKFGGLWERLSWHYQNPDFHDEYNSAKHGFRAKAGGFYFAIDPTNSAGRGNRDAWLVQASSEFGMSYFKEQMLEKSNPKRNFTIAHHMNNWHPLNYCYALDLIASSIANIILYLKVSNGENFEGLFAICPDPEMFDKPWGIEQTDAFKVTVNAGEISDSVRLLSKDEILQRYKRPSRSPDS